MADGIFKRLSDALLTRDDEAPLVMRCTNSYEVIGYMSVFITAFINYLAKTDPSFSPQSPCDLVKKETGEYTQAIGDYHFHTKLDGVARTISLTSDKPYNKKIVRACIEDINKKLFHSPMPTKNNYLINATDAGEILIITSILTPLCEAHRIPFRPNMSSAPLGLLVSKKNFENLCKHEKLPGLGLDLGGANWRNN